MSGDGTAIWEVFSELVDKLSTRSGRFSGIVGARGVREDNGVLGGELQRAGGGKTLWNSGGSGERREGGEAY